MNGNTPAGDPAKTDKAESAKATPAAVRVKVLKKGLEIAGSSAAFGAIINVSAADAALFESRKEVVVIGAAK